MAAKGDEDEAEGQEAEDAWKRRGTSPVQPNPGDTETKMLHWGRATATAALSPAAVAPGKGLCDFRGQNVPIPAPIPTGTVPVEPSPRRSMVSLILLAAFSLSSPGWLLLMEKSVMTPAVEDEGVRVWGHPR